MVHSGFGITKDGRTEGVGGGGVGTGGAVGTRVEEGEEGGREGGMTEFSLLLGIGSSSGRWRCHAFSFAER